MPHRKPTFSGAHGSPSKPVAAKGNVRLGEHVPGADWKTGTPAYIAKAAAGAAKQTTFNQAEHRTPQGGRGAPHPAQYRPHGDSWKRVERGEGREVGVK